MVSRTVNYILHVFHQEYYDLNRRMERFVLTRSLHAARISLDFEINTEMRDYVFKREEDKRLIRSRRATWTLRRASTLLFVPERSC